MEYTLLFSVLSLILVQHVFLSGAALQVDTMDAWKSTIALYDPSYGYSSSGILKSHSGFSYATGRNKTVTVTIPFGYSLMVSIKYIDLRPNDQDMLTLFSVDGKTNPARYSNSYTYRKKQYYAKEQETYYVPSGNLGVTFFTGPSSLPTYGYDGFYLVYTVQAKWVRCNSRDFVCDNGRCIAKILQCDGHNHCGDRSSEENCRIAPTTGGVVGISFGCIFLIIAIACGVYVICRRRGYRRETTRVITSHPPPTTHLPSYPPVYPHPGANYPPPPPPYSQGITNQGYQ